jgi:hypothetical protein
MSLASLLSQLRRSFTVDADEPMSKVNPESALTEVSVKTIPVNRPLSGQEHAIAKWLLLHATPPASDFLAQLDVARVSGHCGCGCPTADLTLPEGTPRAEPRDNPIGDAVAEVNGKMVGVMLLQRDGYLTCLEIYDLSDIEHPYGLPELRSFRPWDAAAPSDPTDC